MTQESPPRASLLGGLIALAIGLVFFLGIGEIGLRIARPEWRDYYNGRFMVPTIEPGRPILVIGQPGFDGGFAQNNGDFHHRIRINEFGLRNDEPVAAADGRIWIVGDSMAFGWGVERDDSYTAQLAKELGQPTYNVASPGADVCGYQSLYLRMPKELRPKAVVVGLILENDVDDYDCAAQARADQSKTLEVRAGGASLGALKMTLTEHSALYNTVTVALKRVPAVTSAMVSLGVINAGQAYQSFFPEADMPRMVDGTVKALAELKAMLPPGTPMVVLVAPSRFEIANGDPYYTHMRQMMDQALAAHGIDHVDPVEAFKQAGLDTVHFAHDGHWHPAGHRMAAKALADWFRANRAAQ